MQKKDSNSSLANVQIKTVKRHILERGANQTVIKVFRCPTDLFHNFKFSLKFAHKFHFGAIFMPTCFNCCVVFFGHSLFRPIPIIYLIYLGNCPSGKASFHLWSFSRKSALISPMEF